MNAEKVIKNNTVNTVNIEEKILEDYNYLYNTGYDIEEIVNFLSQKYKIEVEKVKEIIYRNLTVFYPLLQNLNKFILFTSFISFIFYSLITNSIVLGIVTLIVLIYVSIVIDYLIMSNKIKPKLGLFFLSLAISFILLSSLGFFSKEQLILATPMLLSLIGSFYYLLISKNVRLVELFRTFFLFNIIYFTYLFVLFIILLVFFILLNKFISSFFIVILASISSLAFCIYASKFFIKNKTIKTIANIIKIFASLILIYVFVSDISLVANKAITNFSNFYNLQEIDKKYKLNSLNIIKSELGFYNCSKNFNSFKVYIEEIYNDKNYNVSEKYKNMLKKIVSQKSCVSLKDYFEYNSLLQIISANYFEKTKCYNELEKAAQEKDKEFRQKLLEKINNLSKKNTAYYINLMITINNFNNCEK